MRSSAGQINTAKEYTDYSINNPEESCIHRRSHVGWWDVPYTVSVSWMSILCKLSHRTLKLVHRRIPTQEARPSQINLRLHDVLICPVVDAQIQLWASWRFITPTNSHPQSSCQTTLNFRTGNVCLRQWPHVHWRPCPCPSPVIYRYRKFHGGGPTSTLNYQLVISKLVMVLEEYMVTKSGRDYTWHKSTIIAQCGSHCC